MPYEEDHLETSDGLRLHVSCWLPDAPAKAAVVLLHGFTEHGGRYAELAERLARLGYAVYAADFRGHGRSEGERIFVISTARYFEDADKLLEHVREREPGRPVFLFGHSLGGMIAAMLASLMPENFRGVVLSAPAVRVGKNVYPILRRLARIVGRWFPRLRVVRLGSGMLSRDEAVVEDFKNDPLVYHGRIPTRTAAEILRTAEILPLEAKDIRVPLLILHGTADGLTDPAGSQELYDLAASPDKTLRLYPGLYHDLVHEPEREEVMADVVGWIEGRMEGEG
jgi:acylglycerol lipase